MNRRTGARAGWLIAAALLMAPAQRAHAWGEEGHRIVALVAQHFLSERTRTRLQALLTQDDSGLTVDTSMASEATWADHYRDSDRDGTRVRYERTWRWHFINLELTAPDLASACFGEPRLPPRLPASEGPARDCTVDKIDEFEVELASPLTPGPERLRALQFLLHLVGDAHQPLHAADDHDEGGNRLHVSARAERAGNLHHYWDTVFVEELGDSAPQVANALWQQIGPRELAAWRRGRPQDWVLESFGLAQRVAYGELPAPTARGRYRLSARYMRDSRAVVALQLSRAGVRLAWLLERALGPDGRASR
ncbi:MAG TPA: S1/P1 nuclease [Steroidobacteraceae bacterium]